MSHLISKSFKNCSQLGRLETSMRYEVNCGNLAPVTTNKTFYSLIHLCQAFHVYVNFTMTNFQAVQPFLHHIHHASSSTTLQALPFLISLLRLHDFFPSCIALSHYAAHNTTLLPPALAAHLPRPCCSLR